MRQADALYYLFGDHLGSTTLTYNPTSGARARQLFMPYARRACASRWPSPSTLPTDYRFTGQRSEEARLDALYDYGARFYDAALGRFLSPDSIVTQPGDPQSLNRYAYVRNNPLRYIDPTGHVQACAEGALEAGCGRDRTIYTHSPVQFPMTGLDDHDREVREGGQAIAATTMAEIGEMLAAAASDSARATKSMTKQVIGYEIARTLPSSGAASIGICATGGVTAYGAVCPAIVAADSKGNIVAGGALGAGGSNDTHRWDCR
jgi:RHS repeat-associated protein